MAAEPIMMPGIVRPETTVAPAASPTEGQAAKVPRKQSTIDFPYYQIDNLIQLVDTIYQNSGPACDLDRLAALLRTTVTSSGFKMRLSAARMFGLVEREDGRVVLTSLGERALDGATARAAKADAFLSVPLYRAVYEQYRGRNLPPARGLESVMVTLGVTASAAERARWNFERSAEQAGFFEHGKDRLVNPVSPREATQLTSAPAPTSVIGSAGAQERALHVRRDDTSGPTAPVPAQHPLIQGMLMEMPPLRAAWDLEDRAKWLRAFANALDLLYEGSGQIRVSASETGSTQSG